MLELNINAAIAAHKAWRTSFQTAIDGLNAEKLFDLSITDYTRCVLGSWLYAHRQQALDGLEIFHSIKDVHIEFHQAAGLIFNHLEQGDVDEAQKVLEGQFTLVSDALILLLEELRDNYAPLLKNPKNVQTKVNLSTVSLVSEESH